MKPARILVLLLAFAALFSVAHSARAQDRVNLSADQKHQLQQLLQDNRQKTATVRKSLGEKRRALLQLYSSYDLNEKKARQTISAINSLQQQLLDLNYQTQVGLRKILTKDQFEAFAQRLADRPHRFGNRNPSGDHTGLREPGEISKDELDKLDLTPDQDQRIRRLFKDSGKPIFEQMRTRADAVKQLYGNYDLDEKRAQSLLDNINNAQRKALDANFKRQVEIRKILNEDQFTQLMADINSRFMNRPDRGSRPR